MAVFDDRVSLGIFGDELTTRLEVLYALTLRPVTIVMPKRYHLRFIQRGLQRSWYKWLCDVFGEDNILYLKNTDIIHVNKTSKICFLHTDYKCQGIKSDFWCEVNIIEDR